MSETTKGSQVSNFPDSLPDFTAQSEALDPTTEDDTLAEGKDANIWSAEIEAIADTLGLGGRAEVTVATTTGVVETLSYLYQGVNKNYAGTTSLSLQSGQINYIYLNPSLNAVVVSTSGWPTVDHLRLAIWNDSIATASLTDSRPHTLQITGPKFVDTETAGQYIMVGTGTVLEGNTSIAVLFGVTYSSAPKITFGGQRPGDSTLRIAGSSNKTVTGFTLHINTAAPSGGVAVDWIAFGTYASDTSGSS